MFSQIDTRLQTQQSQQLMCNKLTFKDKDAWLQFLEYARSISIDVIVVY
jgi:hypothetical protein